MRGMMRLAIMGVPGAQGAQNYSAMVLATQPDKLLSYVPLDEASGAVATDLSGNNRHAAYGASVQLAATTFLDGRPAPAVNGSFINWYSDSLRDAWNGDEYTVAGWIKVPAAAWGGGAQGMVFNLQMDVNNQARIAVNASLPLLTAYRKAAAQTTIHAAADGVRTDQWLHIANGASRAQNKIKTWINGEFFAEFDTAGDWTGTLAATTTCIGAGSTSASDTLPGYIARSAVWSALLTDEEVAALYASTGKVRKLFFVGDSKTAGDRWTPLVRTGLNAAPYAWHAKPTMFAVAGWTVAMAKAHVDANLAAVTDAPDMIIINLGANDSFALPAEATWKADYTGMIDAFRAKWGAVPIYLTLPWQRDHVAECNTIAGWIADIIALYPSGVLQGIDERVVIEGGDNGVTNTTDGTHYSNAGQIAAADAWLVVLTA